MFIIKILLGGLNHEINSFAPGKTCVEDYKRKQFWYGEEMLRGAADFVRCGDDVDGLAACYHTLNDAGAEIIPAGFLCAQPGPPIEQSVVDDYVERVKSITRENLPLDGVVLFMHGAAQSEESDDPEGDIITAIREIVGPEVPICVGLDLHANVTDRIVKNSNTVSLYQRYPHVDIWETGARAAQFCLDILSGKIAPKMGYVKIPMIVPASSYTTETEPFASLMARGHEYVRQGRLLDFSIAQMQPWLDVNDGYSSVVTISENEQDAESIAKELAEGLWNIRHSFKMELTSIDEVISIAEKNESGKPVILNDFADSSNAGSGGDSAEVIERILALESDVKALMYINDARFVAACKNAGVGNTVTADLGGTICKHLFTPVHVTAELKAIFDGVVPFHGMYMDFGPSAVVKIRNTFVIVTTEHRNNGDPYLYRAFGYDPADFEMIVVKACTSYRAFYAPITDLMYPVSSKGAATSDLLSLPYKKIPKSFYPFSDGGFTAG